MTYIDKSKPRQRGRLLYMMSPLYIRHNHPSDLFICVDLLDTFSLKSPLFIYSVSLPYFILVTFRHIILFTCSTPTFLFSHTVQTHLTFLLYNFCLLDIRQSDIHVRKLPWLSRQSDRLLTDRSLVRSQAEAPFLLFCSSLKT